MKFLFDLFPVIVFFAAWALYDIYAATAATIAATLIQVAWSWLRYRKVDKMLWITLIIVILFGGATLVLRDPTFIKIKPTIVYWVFAVILAGAQLVMGRNLMRAAMEHSITLPDAIWQKLNWSWIAFFAFMGAINLGVAYLFSETVWVNFKVFGAMGLMLLFMLAQGMVIMRHMPDDK